MASLKKRPSGKWRARYRDDAGQEHAKHFDRKTDAQDWLDGQTAKLVAGTHVPPRREKTTVSEWCETWLKGYRSKRPSTVRQAEVHIAKIKATFGHRQLGSIRPSEVKTWIAELKAEGLKPSYIYALHSRLSQIYTDAMHDGLVARNPCSRKTSPPAGKQKPYVATTDQVWALYAAMPERLRATILTGAFIGTRGGEACGLRTSDLDLARGVWHPANQFPAEPLKTEKSTTPVPFPASLAAELQEHAGKWTSDQGHFFVNEWGDQLSKWALERAIRAARGKVKGLPATFTYHDLRHYFASLLIAHGADVKVVQERLRHASAKTTLDTYGHLWPDTDDSTRAAVDSVIATMPGRATDDAA